MRDPELISKTVYYQLADIFEISAIYYHEGRLILRARPHFPREQALELMHRRLKLAGFEGTVHEDAAGLLIGIKEKTERKLPTLNVVLFLATVVTMFFAPVFNTLFSSFRLSFDFLSQPGGITERIEFTVALMSILVFHEFGHYFMGKKRGVLMSLPYFIPAPNFVGTFGALIKSRSPFTNRRDLIEVGAAGPIAGFVISVIAVAIGLWQSQIIPTSMAGMHLGDSLLTKFLGRLIIGPLPAGYDFILSPIAFAGWVGLLVTMLNLLPLGQLDGGHIFYGLVGKHQYVVGRIFFIIMILLGIKWPGWWIFGALVFLFGVKHPPTFNDSIPPSRASRIMGLAAVVIFIISFIPFPFTLD